jgi:hypothetical protein
MRRRHTYSLATVGLALILAVGLPAAAFGASYQYALNRAVTNYQVTSSAIATVAGGKASLGSTSPGGTYLVIQTVSSTGVLIASSVGAGSVTMSHPAYSSAKSRCYWYYSFGTISGTYPINCWRYQ